MSLYAVRAQVTRLLEGLAADPANGIARIMGRDEIARDGGFPDAEFLVAFKPGYEIGFEFTGPLVSKPTHLGMHGYPPDEPQMRASFFIVGPKIAASNPLGEIDMRRIAPTLARILNVTLKDAELEPVSLLKR
jgi:predicted AlkP superfamily pyrophosphatase or phosphodiesterase